MTPLEVLGWCVIAAFSLLAVLGLILVGLYKAGAWCVRSAASWIRRRSVRQVLDSRELRRQRLGGHLAESMERQPEQRVTETHEPATPLPAGSSHDSRYAAKRAIDHANFEDLCRQVRETTRSVDEALAAKPSGYAGNLDLINCYRTNDAGQVVVGDIYGRTADLTLSDGSLSRPTDACVCLVAGRLTHGSACHLGQVGVTGVERNGAVTMSGEMPAWLQANATTSGTFTEWNGPMAFGPVDVQPVPPPSPFDLSPNADRCPFVCAALYCGASRATGGVYCTRHARMLEQST